MHGQRKLTREDLYQMVWDRPTVQVAAELGFSDVMIGKICKRMDVPKPPLGYWRKKETGKNVKRSPLPKATDRTVDSVFLNRTVNATEDVIPREILNLIAKEDLPENQVRIHSSLENAHPLVQRAQLYFEEVDRFQNDAIELPPGEGYLDISVSASLVNRALRIADGLIKALEDRGYEVVVSNNQWWGEATRVGKEGEEIELSLYEQMNKVRRELTDEERKKPPYLIVDSLKTHSTGKLSIKIRSNRFSYQLWRDKSEQPLEDRLNEVIVGVIFMLEPLVFAKRGRVEEEKRRLETIRKAKEENAKIEKLENDAARWATSNNIRGYLRVYRAKLIEIHGSLTDGSDEARWLEWAERYVEKIDPLNSISSDTKKPEPSK